jgi:hypothetical protein
MSEFTHGFRTPLTGCERGPAAGDSTDYELRCIEKYKIQSNRLSSFVLRSVITDLTAHHQ